MLHIMSMFVAAFSISVQTNRGDIPKMNKRQERDFMLKIIWYSTPRCRTFVCDAYVFAEKKKEIIGNEHERRFTSNISRQMNANNIFFIRVDFTE